MLERDGDAAAWLSSVVRYAPASRFSAHTHGGGKEFFVLASACQDRDGGPGRVRAPVGRAPALRSDRGCRLYVKRGHLRHPPAATGTPK